MPNKAHYQNWVSDQRGVPIAGASVTVYNDGTTTPYSGVIYDAAGSVVTNPLTTATNGRFDIYLDAGADVNIRIFAAGKIDQTVEHLTIPDDPGTVVRTTGAQTITGAKTLNSAILNNPTLVSPVIATAILLANGSASNPVLAQNTSSGTGMFFPATGQIAWALATAEAARLTAAGLITRILDAGGMVFHIDRNSPDPTGATSSSTALDTTLAEAAAAGGGTVQLGKGTYTLTKFHVLPDKVQLAGLGDATVIKRAYNVTTPLLACGTGTSSASGVMGNGGAGVSFRDFKYDGDYTNNQNMRQCEIDLRGTDNTALRITMVNCRYAGVDIDGIRPSMLFCRTIGMSDGAVNNNGGGGLDPTNGTFVAGAQSFYGATKGGLVMGSSFVNHGTGGTFIGGSDARLIDNYFEGNHVHYTVTGGGQIAFPTTGLDGIRTRGVVCVGNVLKAGGGRLASGIETGGIEGGIFTHNWIENQQLWGFCIADGRRLVITNNIVKNSGTAKAISGFTNIGGIQLIAGGVTRDVLDVQIMGNHCFDDQGSPTQDWGIRIDPDVGAIKADFLTIVGNDCRGNINAAGISLAGTGTNIHCWANWPVSSPSQVIGQHVFSTPSTGTAIWPVIVRNANVGGSGVESQGILVQAGSTGFDTTAEFQTYNGTSRLKLVGTGQSTQTSSQGDVATLNTTAAAGNNQMQRYQRSGSLKGSVGLDASDNVVIHGSGGTPLVTLNDTYTTMATAPGLDQGGSVAVLSVSYARYKQFGKWVHVMVRVVANANGIAGNAIGITLPSSNPNLSSLRTGNTIVVGSALYLDSGTTVRQGAAVALTATKIVIQCDGKGDNLGTASDALTMAANDIVILDLMYELA